MGDERDRERASAKPSSDELRRLDDALTEMGVYLRRETLTAIAERFPALRRKGPLTGEELAEKHGFKPHAPSGASQVIGAAGHNAWPAPTDADLDAMVSARGASLATRGSIWDQVNQEWYRRENALYERHGRGMVAEIIRSRAGPSSCPTCKRPT